MSTSALIDETKLPSHNNMSVEGRKSIKDLTKEQKRIVMKADKGNCFIVMDRTDYNGKNGRVVQ